MLNMSGSDRLDLALGAIAHPTRRRILRLLTKGDARVTDLAGEFDVSLNAVSRHIQVLERSGLVRRRLHGREHVLSLDTRPLDTAAAWIDQQRTAWSARLRAMDEALHREDEATAQHRARRERK